MAKSWVERDAARVWHGFTQMAAFAGNQPLIVERAEGNELVDVDGRRYLDGIAELGAINAVRLAAAAFAPRRPLVALNRFDPADELHVANLAWLRRVDGFEVLTDAAELASRLADGTVP